MTTNLVEMTGAYQPEKTNENKRLRSGRRVKQDDKRRIAMRRKSNKKLEQRRRIWKQIRTRRDEHKNRK